MRKLIEALYGDGTDGFEYEIQRVTSLGADERGVDASGRAEVSLLLLSGEVLRSTGTDREWLVESSGVKVHLR